MDGSAGFPASIYYCCEAGLMQEKMIQRGV